MNFQICERGIMFFHSGWFVAFDSEEYQNNLSEINLYTRACTNWIHDKERNSIYCFKAQKYLSLDDSAAFLKALYDVQREGYNVVLSGRDFKYFEIDEWSIYMRVVDMYGIRPEEFSFTGQLDRIIKYYSELSFVNLRDFQSLTNSICQNDYINDARQDKFTLVLFQAFGVDPIRQLATIDFIKRSVELS